MFGGSAKPSALEPGQHAVVTNRDGGVSVVDINSPSAPVVVGLVDTAGLSLKVMIVDDVADVTDGGGVPRTAVAP